MNCRGFVVAGTQTGVGKTTLSLGLMRAYLDGGRSVQPFKVGPDFIDPTHHRVAAERPSYNLDGWMLSRSANREHFRRCASGADVAVVEGVMGLFDGAEGASDRGSTAEMARWLDLPVVLVVDAWELAGSVAPLVEGFARFDSELDVAGVVLNRVAAPAHEETLREGLERVDGVEVLGAIPADDELEIPERHLGLELAGESTLPETKVEAVADRVRTHLELESLYRRAGEVRAPETDSAPEVATDVRLGVARDEAFRFYYRDNLDRLERAGAELVECSPVEGEWPTDLDGLYLGGGYPELAAEALSENREFLEAVREFSRAGGPVYAECGGLILLGRAVETTDGERHEMAGVFPWTTQISERPHLDYAAVECGAESTVFEPGTRARGHFFHYSRIVEEPDAGSVDRVYRVEPKRGEPREEGYLERRTLASYIHLHFGSAPGLAASLVEACRAFRDGDSG